MAKKSRRTRQQRKTSSTAPQSRPTANATTPAGSLPEGAVPAAAGVSASPQVDFRTEYYYVLTDLKNMGILAAVMFGILVVLAFIVQ